MPAGGMGGGVAVEIYISASWKQRVRVRSLAKRLREAGFDVFDFTDPGCRRAPVAAPEWFPEAFDPQLHDYSEYLNRPEWQAAVWENREVLERCDAVVLLLPCGIDATADWAYAVAQGKLTVVVGHPSAGERSPVHLWADDILPDDDACIQWLRQVWRASGRAAQNGAGG